jgi:7,8-didemethyl-8-hydroxy-5-deazariboflavin synthase CofG subunit
MHDVHRPGPRAVPPTLPPMDPDRAVALLEGRIDPTGLLAEAAAIRDEAWGRTVTYSRKVFIPLTTLCNSVCTYCTFAKPPGNGGEYLVPDDVLAIARAGAAHGCTEALFTLGDRPERRWPQAREFLATHGVETTLEYVRDMSRLVVEETGVFPHANPGIMDADAMAMLRPHNPSMGMMLENISPRLTEPGMPHEQAPEKDPGLRVATIEASGSARVPFTTGVLVGIGETTAEVVDSILALADLARRLGSIQEVIIQNFRAKADTRMRRSPEPIPAYFARVVALARVLLPPEVSVQVPPNLTERYEALLASGVNDWGGVSPLTIDWVNPDQPWPHLDELRSRTEAAGFDLRPRLPVYPRYIGPEWIDPGLLARVESAADDDGWASPVVTGVGLSA